MRFLVNNKIYDITAREWNGEQYKPDCFGDIADNETMGMTYNHEFDAWETTQERIDEIISWWTEEFKCWSEGHNDAGGSF